MLQIKDLAVTADNKKILDKFNLDILNGEIHVIMGPNGAGKSTICSAILGSNEYIVNGSIKFNDTEITNMDTTSRSRLGIFLLNQNPIAIEGVTNAEMLRTALYERTGERISIFEFNKKMESICNELGIPKSFIHRNINEGMSGGERKKNELLHLWMLNPSLVILDELDSGLDVDSLKTVCNSINKYYKEFTPSILIITHHIQILNYIKPNYVHILKDSHIVSSGDIHLAEEIENIGFNTISESLVMSDSNERE